MHIPDGFLNAATSIGTGVVAAGGIGAAIADALRATDGATPEIRVLGLPTQFLTHGSPDDILARHGLDAAGIAAAAGA